MAKLQAILTGKNEEKDKWQTNPNLLDNWYFVKPVNRNGQTKYEMNGYFIDRWRKTGNVITLTIEGLDASNGVWIYQDINNNVSEGDELTYTVLTSTDLYTITGKANKNENFHINTPFGWQTFSYNKDKQCFSSNLTINDNASATIVAVKLERGIIQTLAHKENNKWILNEIPNYAEEYAKCIQYSLSTGEHNEILYTNKNHLDNWYFIDPINQQNLTTYVGQRYTIDRWRNWSNTTLTLDGGISYTANSMFGQPLEGNFRDRIMTASILLADGTLHYGTGKIDSNVITFDVVKLIDNSKVQIYLQRHDSPETSTRVIFLLKGTGKALAAKLEDGYQQTLAHQENGKWVLNEIPDKQQMLARCQRFYEITGFVLDVAADKNYQVTLPWKVTKRIAGTATVQSLGAITSGKIGNFVNNAWQDITATATNESTFGITIKASGLSAGSIVGYRAIGNANL